MATSNVKFAVVNATDDGDNTVIAAVANTRLRVLGYTFSTNAAGAFLVKSGASTVKARFNATSAQFIFMYAGGSDAPAFETDIGEALIIDPTAAQDVVGHLCYIEIPTTY